MKNVILSSNGWFVMAIGLAFAGACSAQPMIALMNSERRVSAIELSKVVDWKPGDGGPCPLTRDKAVEIAKAEVAKKGRPPFADEEIRVHLHEGFINDKAERRLVPENACLWYYTIEMGSVQPKVARIHITMSGAIMEGSEL